MNIEEIFGVRVFDDAAMKKRLPKKAYESLSRTRRLGEALDPEIADVVACAMKDWAIEQGATHYSHWFQPMNNFTAGKHDAFLSTTGKDGSISLDLGPDLPGLCAGRDAVYPHRLLLLQRRGAGRQDPAAALDAGGVQAGRAPAARFGERDGQPHHSDGRRGAGVFSGRLQAL